MAQVITGFRNVQLAVSGKVAPPTDFTSLGRIMPTDPTFTAEAVDDGQGYPLFQRVMFEHIVDVPDVSKKDTIDGHDNTECNVAFERIDGTYELYKTVLLNSLVPSVRDGYQVARFRVSAAPRDIMDVLGTMSATSGSAAAAAAGSNVRSGYVKSVHFNLDGGVTSYSFTQIAEDVTIGDNTPTQRYSSGKTRALGKMARIGMTILDRDIFTTLNTHQMANSLIDTFDIVFNDGTQFNMDDVGFTVVPAFSASVGGLYGTRIDIVGYSDALADYLALAPAFV